ncbi:hypothetical protein ZIOFF_000824 [Zingiber officinale]|uniref:Uncharacterized protein n=1 Tax=Zingiber officinale TaxID=94328 RepID=A0A8J5I8U4_ZINOF|nr:hypothetical protein ZIOFF_000824 [Zingiber officinale]
MQMMGDTWRRCRTEVKVTSYDSNTLLEELVAIQPIPHGLTPQTWEVLCNYWKSTEIRYAFELLTNALWKRDYDLFGIDEHSESFLVGEFQVLVTSMVYSGSLRCAHAIHQCLEEEREKIMTIPRKEKKRKARREEKAEKAAVLDMVFRRCIGCLEDA